MNSSKKPSSVNRAPSRQAKAPPVGVRRPSRKEPEDISAAAAPASSPSNHFKITPEMLARAARPPQQPYNPFVAPPAQPLHPPRVRSDGMAQDAAITSDITWASANALSSVYAEGQSFLGYSYLAVLAQRPEYRRISETIANQMTRKWIKLTAAGDDEAAETKADAINQLNDELDRLKVRDRFRDAAEHDGLMGRSHIFVDLGIASDDEELRTPIGNGRDRVSAQKIQKGRLKSLKTVEAVWCYPTDYNATDPLADDWYDPVHWNVMARQVHRTRLLTFVGRKVPDMLKPAYSFGGLSLSQMAKPYVDNWLRTRQSVSDLVHSFSVSGLQTDLQSQLAPGGQDIFSRVDLFNLIRDNRGLMMLNKNTEEFFNVSTPLGTLDQLQAQAQEQMGAVSATPLVFLLGISPHGLNASSEGEIRVFYDWIASYQEKLFSENLRRVIGFAQLNLWGKVDPEITFQFEPLWSLDEKAAAEVREIDARTAQIHVDSGAISPEEERARIAGDPDTQYPSLDLADPPDLEEEIEGGLTPKSGTLGKSVEEAGEEDGVDETREAA